MRKTALSLLCLCICASAITQSSKTDHQQVEAYSDFYSLALNNWCGVFSGVKAIDPCFLNEENAKTLTGKNYRESEHLRLLRSSITCKTNPHRINTLDFLIASDLFEKKEKLVLIKYTMACQRAHGKIDKELKVYKKELKKLLEKDEYNESLVALMQTDEKSKNYESLLYSLNRKIEEKIALENVED